MSVVDDELDLIRLYKDALSQIEDITVHGFTDPILALEHFIANQKDYQVMLTDYRIPEMNGVELLREVKEINPSVKTLLISAFDIKDNIILESVCVDKILQKPIAMKALIEEVQAQIKHDYN